MDDRTTGIGDERMAGFGDDRTVGRSDEAGPRRRSPGADVTRNRGDEDARVSIADRDLEDEPRTDQIRAEIEQTREDMSETIDAIQDRLRPRNIAANAAASVRDTASAAVESVRSMAGETLDDVADSRVMQRIEANPVPAIMVGIGVVGAAWLAFAGREGRHNVRRTEVFDHGESAGYYEPRAGSSRPRRLGATSDAGDSYTSGSVGRNVRDLAERTGEYAREAGWQARQTTRNAQNQLQRAMYENPLAVGGAALAIGALIGMSLPETERENELMGEARDNVVSGAQEMARNAANRVQEAATDAAKQVQDAVTDVGTLLNTDKDKNP